ncbi:MAG: hypothetical protein H0T72_01170, partial [Chloroflexia bacterium]|nr:hypothetical protein [Chloroflexia bacterium]
MSTNRPPHPNGDPHNHDLQPARWADASETDADALDALLNEIAQGNGFPSTQSGHVRRRPDARSDDGGPAGEAGALHAAARSFHRRFDAAQGRDPGSAAVDPHLWEQIMTATTNPAPETRRAQGAVWVNATRHALAPGVSPRSQHHTRQRWGGFANATLALVILLAGFGVWRFYDGLNGSGPADPEGMAPGIAMRPATPEGTEVLTVDAPPVATPAPITACNFSADIPLFPEVDVSPIDGTALLLTTSGDLVLTCPEEPMGVVLASRVQTTLPLNWPGIVFLSTGSADPAEQSLSAINVLMGESVEIGMHPDGMQYQLHNDPSSPWLVAPDDENPNDWAITDLRTMESRLLSEYAASSAADGMEILTTANANGAIAIGLQTPESAESDGALFEGVDLPGNLLVIDGSLDAPRWIGLPDDLPRITEMLLAPDGRHLALKTTEDGDIPT